MASMLMQSECSRQTVPRSWTAECLVSESSSSGVRGKSADQRRAERPASVMTAAFDVSVFAVHKIHHTRGPTVSIPRHSLRCYICQANASKTNAPWVTRVYCLGSERNGIL